MGVIVYLRNPSRRTGRQYFAEAESAMIAGQIATKLNLEFRCLDKVLVSSSVEIQCCGNSVSESHRRLGTEKKKSTSVVQVRVSYDPATAWNVLVP